MRERAIENLRRFYDMNSRELYAYARSLTHHEETAEDAVHEAFARILERRSPPRDLRPYVFRCVRNAAIDLARKAKRGRSTSSLFQADQTNAGTNGYTLEGLESMLNSLSADERECIVLKIYSGLTFKDIARTRGVSLNTAASWYRRGLAKLRDGLSEENT